MADASADGLAILQAEVGAEIDSGDTAWVLTATALVLLMSLPGLGLFYGGLVRSKNVLMQLNYVFVAAAEVTILWFLWGFSIAFSDGNMSKGSYNLNSFFGTLAHGAMKGVTTTRHTGTIPLALFATFQGTFAIITVALISGAFAERLKLSAALMFNACWLVLVYCPLAHMVWGGDGAFIHSLGALDYAGGLVVHISSGCSGLVVALLIGKRKGYPRIPKAPHSLTLSYVGACLLWVGWFGFNAGSALAADSAAAQAMLVTHTSSAMAALTWMCAETLAFQRPSTLGMISGAVAGLVTVTPAAGYVNFTGALFIGAVAGPVCLIASTVVKERIDAYDDALDAFGVHGVGGILGALLTAIWAEPDLGGTGFGTFVYDSGREWSIDNVGFQLGVQAASVGIAVVWSVVGTVVCVKLCDVLHGGLHARVWKDSCVAIRYDPEAEEQGLDLAAFSEQGYNYESADMQISVEMGPLRGRQGHGLQLFYTSESGTSHPVGMPGATTMERDEFAKTLLERGGSLSITSKDGKPMVNEGSVRGTSGPGGVDGTGGSGSGRPAKKE